MSEGGGREAANRVDNVNTVCDDPHAERPTDKERLCVKTGVAIKERKVGT